MVVICVFFDSIMRMRNDSVNYLNEIQTKTNEFLVLLFVLLNLFQLFVLPLYLLPMSSLYALLLIPIGLFTNAYWAIIHEAIHGILHPNYKTNAQLGRLLCFVFGSPFRVVRYGHLQHHRFNRVMEIDQSEVYHKGKTSYFSACFQYYLRLLVGLYLAEVILPILFFLPRHYLLISVTALLKDTPEALKTAQSNLFSKASLRELRLDSLVIYGLMAFAFMCYGHQWYWLLAAYGARGFIISFSDNLPHYATPLTDVYFAYNLKLPRWIEKVFYLNFNYHRVHHHYPLVPSHKLPDVFKEKDGIFDKSYFWQALKQLRGPIRADKLS